MPCASRASRRGEGRAPPDRGPLARGDARRRASARRSGGCTGRRAAGARDGLREGARQGSQRFIGRDEEMVERPRGRAKWEWLHGKKKGAACGRAPFGQLSIYNDQKM